ncbi:SMC domain protein [Acidimicrobium ferrooxidans DSM 10331]|uniref:SMC domain protein n=1 Tax=Acidimicrobium ferrooxidans (strain DSM 10331 / JCM 15462 / NBRC 103882 / ICP) TaxID=525909 RepID=C7M0C2_ACIFD|nr:chromosome segregation SMC family protein [Acidimicrobium ferrooxidans]ACU54430.1 SMC domain protein [Acidimicrobium ferrooxidans DSM 10331]
MRLRALTMRGFKSFADPVTVRFGSGINAIVGPNGSGKSNVVDALTWVLGTQSPRMLRLARMDEVIFQGSAHRPALGRAEVELTLDDPDDESGLGVAEIALTRRVERGGEASYRINGRAARLQDVVEVLQGANIGRSQHVVVSQGEIDALAGASGDVLRTMLEDASRVTLLRRQRQVTLEQLRRAEEALAELEREDRDLRRQRRPLVAQVERAEARRALEARWQVLALAAARRALERRAEELAAAERDVESCSRDVADAEAALVLLEGEVDDAPRVDPEPVAEGARRLRELEVRLTRAIASIDEHQRLVDAERARDQRRRAIAEEHDEVVATLTGLEERARALALMRERLEQERAAIETVDVEPLRAELDQVRRERVRLETLLQERERAAERARAQAERVRLERARDRELERHLNDRDAALAAERAAAEAALAEAEEALADAARELAEAGELVERVQRDRAVLAERHSSLTAEARRIDVELRSVLEAVGDEGQGRLTIDVVRSGTAGIDVALAALGELAEARIVQSVGELDPTVEVESAVVIEEVEGEHGSAAVGWAPGPLGARLAQARVVESVLEEVRVGRAHGLLVDAAGWVSDDGWIRRGRSIRALLRLRRRQLEDEAVTIAAELQGVGEELAAVDAALREARAVVERCRSTHVEELNRREARRRDLERIRTEQARIDRDRATVVARLATELPTVDIEDVDEDVGRRAAELQAREAAAADRLAMAIEAGQAAERARQALDEQLVGVRLDATREQQRALAARERLDQLERERARLDEARVRATPVPRELVERAHALANAVALTLRGLDEQLQLLLAWESRHRAEAERLRMQRRSAEAALVTARERLLEAMGRAERARARLAAEQEMWCLRLHVELADIEGARLPSDVAPNDVERTLHEVEDALGTFGEVNGLASVQLRELDARREELGAVLAEARGVRAVISEGLERLEEEMRRRVLTTVEEVGSAFRSIIGELFPGGGGSVELEAGADPLAATVRVDVDLPTKRVRRLALLSGGERSLVGLALLFAMLEVRPVPFLVLDEADAALDERNLTRLVELLRRVGRSSQVLVVTHQRRTMEAADVLLGVSIAPSGVSTVVRHDLGEAGLEGVQVATD